MKLSFIKIALLLLSALLYVQTYPANDYYPLLVWVALVPWFMALEKNSWKMNTLLSLLFSTLVWLVYLWTPFYDATFMISNETFIASVLTFLHLLSYMIPFIITGALYNYFRSYRLLDTLYLASIFTFLSMSIPTLFTFNMGTALYDSPILLQVVDISGVSLLLWLILVVNISLKNIIVLLLEKKIKKDFLYNSAMIVRVTLFIVGYGYWHLNIKTPTNLKDKITIATVQPNMGSRLHQLSMVRDNKKSTPYSHIELSRKALSQNDKIDLLVWPEGGLLVDCDNQAILKKLSAFTKEIATPLMYQCNKCTDIKGVNNCYNQSHYMGVTGQTEAVYNKQNLLPLFENIPDILQKTFVEENFHKELLFKKGEESKVFDNTHAHIIPSLCYDAHSNKLIKKGLELKGELIIIQSNDRIFKHSDIGLYDTAINIISTTSFRLPMVKASNSGYGVFVSSSGKILKDSLTPLYKRHISINTIELRDTFSLYRLYGDWFYLFTLLLMLYLLINKFLKNG